MRNKLWALATLVVMTFATVWLLRVLVVASTVSGDRQRWNVLLVTIDTLRVDHLGLYGYDRNTSPNLDDFAREAAVFDNAIVPVPLTSPSHMSILTGAYPAEHGVLLNAYWLDDSNLTLAEALKEEGYATAAFVGAKWVLGSRFGYGQGFDVYREGRRKERRAKDVNRNALHWLRKNGRREPFFAWVHYYDAHCDYAAPRPFYDMFYPDYAGTLDPRGKCGKTDFDRMLLGEDDLAYVKALYDGEIRYVDHQLGALLKELDRAGIDDRTLVVIVADHGEGLGELGVVGHNASLRDYEVRVPLVVRVPGRKRESRRVEQQVEVVSLGATILDLLGIEAPAPLGSGSFARLLEGLPMPPWPAFVATAPQRRREALRGVRNGSHKLVYRQNGDRELYAIEAATGKERLIGGAPELREELGKALDAWIAAQEQNAAGKDQELSPDVIERLRELGYLE
jgi:arylsulfatase A-like enzyme